MFKNLPTPSVLVDIDRMQNNIESMQSVANQYGVEVWPHIKTHKMLEVARRQLEAGAAGLVCAKIGEAEVMVEAGPPAIFIAHSLVDPLLADRLHRLADSVPELIVACTSEVHCIALENLLAKANLHLPVLLGIDTGMAREGVRDVEAAVALAAQIEQQPHMTLRGLYTYEGGIYYVDPETTDTAIEEIHRRLIEIREAIAERLGITGLGFWPGCSVSAKRIAALPGVQVIRPGAYVFGDLALSEITHVMKWDDMAVTVLATVIDRPQVGLALIDAGSKVFSSDKTPQGITGRAQDGRDLQIVRCNEEHGYVQGADVDDLAIGDRIRFVPAHTCTVINLTDSVVAVRGDNVVDTWKVDARGRIQ